MGIDNGLGHYLNSLSGTSVLNTGTYCVDQSYVHGSKKWGIWECYSQEILPFGGNFDYLDKEILRNSRKFDHIPGKFAFFGAVPMC